MKKIIKSLLLANVLAFTRAHADINLADLKTYKGNNKVFINIGLGRSDNVSYGVQAGFDKIYAIDKDAFFTRLGKIVLKQYYVREKPGQVEFVHLDPAQELKRVLKKIKGRITFLITNHIPDRVSPEPANDILDILNQIGQHRHKNHTIMIEYINYAGTPLFGNVSLDEIIAKLRTINPTYAIKFIPGGHLGQEADAILVAIPYPL